MSEGKLIVELMSHLDKLSEAEILTDYGIEYLQFMDDARVSLKKILAARTARIYVPIGDSYLGMN